MSISPRPQTELKITLRGRVGIPDQTGVCMKLLVFAERGKRGLFSGARSNIKVSPHITPGLKDLSPGHIGWKVHECSHQFTIPAPQEFWHLI